MNPLPTKTDLTNRGHIIKWGKRRLRQEAEQQRGHHGLSEHDVVSFDTYLAGVIAAGCRVLAERHHGYPGSFSQPDDPEGTKASAEWARVLNEIAEGFQGYVNGKFEWDALPPEFERSFDLLREHFGSLWD